MPISQILPRPTSSSVGIDHQDMSPIYYSQTSGHSKCVISISPGGHDTSYKSVSTLTLHDQVTLVTYTLPVLKRGLFSGTISSDDYASYMDTIMEQVKQLLSDITCMKNKLTDNTIYIISLQDDKDRHDHAITSLTIDVANYPDLL